MSKPVLANKIKRDLYTNPATTNMWQARNNAASKQLTTLFDSPQYVAYSGCFEAFS